MTDHSHPATKPAPVPATVPATVLFVGDSVTDCERRSDPDGLGDGYVRVLAATPELKGGTVLNRGISGNRVVDLEARWADDVLAADALGDSAVVSILIGVNDTWRRYDNDDPTSAADFEAGYRRLLATLVARPSIAIVLMEPFLLPVTPEQSSWRDDLDPKIEVVRRLAAEFGATLVPTDVELTRLAAELGDGGAGALAADGVHPTSRGHAVISAIWLEHAGHLLAR
ncbi:GDSL-type esterase/lipase family protein [Herbiconiux sp. CPCC 205763]|uniref:GDSL-type esterase/lipase family protein n=1 Tax=Herbiconiux aconitum TaxID=2970913 RepID=A0ABT2GLC1_9MICO|nr:GDSL-type esterase/lipase family protein [Herbiconiux aconitum]MCS5717010.1 GDSL-type esterase/lipase family protein [Herbiconiux aconitum]